MKRIIFLAVIITLFFSQFIMADIEVGLVHHWKFDKDTSDEKNSNTGELVGTAEYFEGVDGEALNLRNNAYVMVDDSLFPTGNLERTISIVVQLKGDGSDEPVFAYGKSQGNSNKSFIIKQDSRGLFIDFGNNQWGVPNTYSGWTYICVVIPKKGNKMSDTLIYINGQWISGMYLSNNSGNVQGFNTAKGGIAYIGTDLGGNNSFNSAVDDLRIYEKALSATDIHELYKLYEPSMGNKGKQGWSPVLGVVEDGERRALKLEDWIGGEGKKPIIPANSYIGEDGFTSLANAINIRGARGLDGTPGLPPAHEWDESGKLLRFQNPDGTWGDWIDLSCTCEGDSNIITENMTLDVPSSYDTIQDALAYLEDKMITQSAIVTIQVASGTYNDYSGINVKHPNGGQIHILGNTSDQSKCTINFSANTKHALLVSNGSVLGRIDGFTFAGKRIEESRGMTAAQNSTIFCGTKMTIKQFGNGVGAGTNSFIYASSIVVKDNVNHGIVSAFSSSINASYCTVTGNGEYGVYALNNATITFYRGTSKGNGIAGVASIYGSGIEIAEATVEDNLTYGLLATWNGTIYGPDAIVRNNKFDFSPLPGELGIKGGIINN